MNNNKKKLQFNTQCSYDIHKIKYIMMNITIYRARLDQGHRNRNPTTHLMTYACHEVYRKRQQLIIEIMHYKIHY